MSGKKLCSKRPGTWWAPSGLWASSICAAKKVALSKLLPVGMLSSTQCWWGCTFSTPSSLGLETLERVHQSHQQDNEGTVTYHLWEEAERAETSAWRRTGLGGFSLMSISTRRESAKTVSQTLFSGASDVEKGYGHQLKDRKCCLNIEKLFFTARMTQQWHKLSREAVKFLWISSETTLTWSWAICNFWARWPPAISSIFNRSVISPSSSFPWAFFCWASRMQCPFSQFG